MTSSLPYVPGSSSLATFNGGLSTSNSYAFNPAMYTNPTSVTSGTPVPGFTPLCSGTNVAVTGVTNAATAYDWFFIGTGGSNALFTAYGSMPVLTATGIQNKAFVATIANEARAALLPLVKAEYHYQTLASSLTTTISNEITSAGYSLTNVQSSTLDTATKTATAAAYTAESALITAALTRLKSLENNIHTVGGSIDSTSTATGTTQAAVTNLSSFTGAKSFMSGMFDPATLGNGGTTIPSLTATTYANAGTLAGYYTTATTALAASTTLKQMNAHIEMTAQTIFDLYCAQIQGYTSLGTSGNYASASAPVGIVPGIDFEVHLAGTMQSAQVTTSAAAVTAAQSTVGAPSITTILW